MKLICLEAKITDADVLVGAWLFDISLVLLPIRIVGVSEVRINGVSVPQDAFAFYDGSQTAADPLLLREVGSWSPEHIFRDTPYIVLNVPYSDKYPVVGFLKVTASVFVSW